MERVQALAHISRLALCCHSNATRVPIANPPNSVQLEGTPYHSSKYWSYFKFGLAPETELSEDNGGSFYRSDTLPDIRSNVKALPAR